MATVDYPNGVQTAITYDELNRITGLATQTVGYTYTREYAGKITNALELSNRSVTWSYDGINRLYDEKIVNALSGKNGEPNYTLDSVGNRTAVSSGISGLSPVAGTYNPVDELSAETYDANGNVTSTGGKTFSYDAENHLIAMGSTVALEYDGDGKRVAKAVNGVTAQYLVDDLNPTGYPQVVDELTNGVVSRTYTYGLQRISQDQVVSNTWTPSFYVYDGGGNVRALTNTSGATTDQYEYDAFGNQFTISGGSNTPNEMLYRGEMYDSDLGLYYLRARYYNPTTGRFMSRDPEDGNRLDPQSFHKYLYAGGDPVNSIDPSGRASILETGSLDSLIGSAPVPALIEFAGTQAENFLLASGIQDAIAGLELAADAGSYEEVVDILGYTARAILKSRPLVRAYLCAPVALAFDFGVDKLNEYAKEHNWTFFQTKAMDTALDVGKDSLKEACGAFVALGGR